MELLSNEIVFQILYELSIPDILTFCSLSSKLVKFTREDITLWKELVIRDFNQTSKEEETWRKEYVRLSELNANDILLKGVRSDDFKLIDYAVYCEASNYDRGLLMAAEKGNQTLLDRILKLMDEDGLDPNYNQFLKAAAKKGHYKIVEKMCHTNVPNLNLKDIICNGIECGHYCIFACLEDLRIDPNNLNEFMLSAVRGGHMEIILRLLELMDFYQIKPQYYEALRAALVTGNYEISIFFLTKVQESNNINFYQESLIDAARGGNVKLFQIVSELAGPDSNSIKILKISALSGYQEIVIFLFKSSNLRDILVDATDFYDVHNFIEDHFDYLITEIIEETIKGGNVNILRMIISQIEDGQFNIDLNYIFSSRIQSAVQFGRIEMLKFLLDKIDTNRCYVSYENLVFNAVDKGYPAMLEMILKIIKKRGVCLNYDNIFKEIFIIKESTRILIQKITTAGIYPHRLLYLAIKGGDLELVKLMIEDKGVKVDSHDMMIAIQAGQSRIVDYFLKQCSDPFYHGMLINGARINNLKTVKTVLNLMKKKNIDPDYVGALIEATTYKRLRVVKFLFYWMKNEGLSSKYGMIMDKAIKSGSYRIVKFIFERMKEDRNGVDYKFYFLRAISFGQCRILRFFHEQILREGIIINYQLAIEKASGTGSKCHKIISMLSVWEK